MPTIAKNRRGTGRPLTQLGGISASDFLRRYWQKKPLLIRQAFAGFKDPLDKRAVLDLAASDDAESRLISFDGKAWQLQNGPLAARDFRAVRNTRWTVLVQDTQHYSADAHALLAQFDFIPRARIDDLMVSYAIPGAGVGAHVDSYDVFLLQGSGRRRWQISSQRDCALKAGVPLKLLARFRSEQEFVLESGDMLYLPPGYAHKGIAETECLTWSIGFRAPTQQELANALLDHLRDELVLAGQYRDPDLQPARHAALIDSGMRRRVEQLLAPLQAATRRREVLRKFLGRFLTEPKPHVYFESPARPLTAATFARAVVKHGVSLDLKTRFLYDGSGFFINGECLDVAARDKADLRRLADRRSLPAGALSGQARPAALAVLHRLYCDGFLHAAT